MDDKVKVGRKYQIVIPRAARCILGLHEGDMLLMHVTEAGIFLMPEPKNYTEFTAGLGKEMWEALGGSEKVAEEIDRAWSD